MTDKTIDHRLAWLAGIIDGEGTISFGLRRERRGKPWIGVDWYVFVPNTDAAMLSEVMAICDILGARYSFFERGCVKPGHRRQFQVIVSHRRSIRALLEATLPYLVTKKANAELLLRALIHRYGDRLNNRDGRLYGATVDDEFRGMVDQIKSMNARGGYGRKEDTSCQS